jgi:dihydrofolate reductase
MRKLVLSINVSLDGFADHTVAIADDELHDYYRKELEHTSIALFGRVTYQLMERYWPYAHEDPAATKADRAFAERFNAIPKIVFSKTIQRAEWNNTSLNNGDMVEEVRRLKAQPGKPLSIGGISAAQALMRHGLIDEYFLAVHPIVVTSGRRLFENIGERQNLELIDTSTFRSGVVVLHYKVKQ